METMKQGGLYGKPRRARARNRAARLRVSELLAEYNEPERPALRRRRPVPICTRSEFLPSFNYPVAPRARERAVRRGGTQLELPFARGDESAKGKAIRFSSTARSVLRPALRRPNSNGRSAGFSVRGFLLGCVMGGAVATSLLLVLRAAAG